MQTLTVSPMPMGGSTRAITIRSGLGARPLEWRGSCYPRDSRGHVDWIVMQRSKDNASLGFVNSCERTYGAAMNFIRVLYENESGVPMAVLSGPPKKRYREAAAVEVRPLT